MRRGEIIDQRALAAGEGAFSGIQRGKKLGERRNRGGNWARGIGRAVNTRWGVCDTRRTSLGARLAPSPGRARKANGL